MDYSKLLSKISSRRRASCIGELQNKIKPSPSLVLLSLGKPNPEKFPFKSLTVTLEDDKEVTLSTKALSAALQYGSSIGYPPLVEELMRITKNWHAPPSWEKSGLLVCLGNQDGVSKALEMLIDPGDYVVVQDPCYSDVLSMLSAVSPQILGVGADEQGMRADLLQEALQQAVKSGSPGIPKAMYLVPNACNPTGTNMTENRRREIYAIAQQHNLIILEDDPYYFLQFSEKIPPSFLSLDVDGRVLRFDSFSKILSPGLRIGYVTGPKPLLQQMNIHMQCNYICAPMLSQVLIHELLMVWGDEGFKKHISDICQLYKRKRDEMVLALQTHCTGLCEWTVPEGGIFIWLKTLQLNDTTSMMMERGPRKGVVLVPGKEFVVDSSKPCPYMRAAYSCLTANQMMKGMENLAKLIQEEVELQKTQA